MDELLEQLALDPWGRLVLHYVATSGLWNCYLFLLVAARLTGALILAPCLITNPIPLLVRIVLVILLSLIVVPTLPTANHAGSDVTQISHETRPPIPLPATIADLVCAFCTEIVLGGLFGAGMIAVFSGLRLAGEWLDRHSGLGMASVLNPEWMAGVSASASLSLWLGIVAFLLIEPSGGKFTIVQSLTQSFQGIPVGSAISPSSGLQFFNGLVQESLVLGLRISMPLIATMMLVDVTLAFAGRGGPDPISSSYQGLRLGIGLFVLAMTLTTIPDAIATTAESVVQWISATLLVSR